MSASIVPPIQPDPFRMEPHPIRDLGSLVGAWDHVYASPSSTVRPRMEVIQLSAEEDQAITSLLKLHHSISTPSQDTLCQLNGSPAECLPANLEDQANACCTAQIEFTSEQQPRWWSDTELQAADGLLGLDLRAMGNPSQGDSEHQSALTMVQAKAQCLVSSCGLEPAPLGPCHVDRGDAHSACALEDSEISRVGSAEWEMRRETGDLKRVEPQDGLPCGGPRWMEEPCRWLQQEEGVCDESEGAVVSALLHLAQEPQRISLP